MSVQYQVTKRRRHTRRGWNLLLLALPPMIFIVLFNYVPLFGWVLALFEYVPGTPIFQNQFVGLKYFQMILTSRDVARAMRNTLIFSSIKFVLLICPMVFAILLNEIQRPRFRKLSQTITTLPYFISWIILYSLAFSIFGTEGLLNQLLAGLGVKQSVLTNPRAVYWFQCTLALWKDTGWNAIIYIAAIAGIDQELYEAATVDGAGRLRCALHVTVPGLMPTFLVLMLLFIANFINSGLDQYFVFKNALVMDTIETIELYAYRLGLQLFDYSFATAIGIMKSVVSIVLLFTANGIAKKVRGQAIV